MKRIIILKNQKFWQKAVFFACFLSMTLASYSQLFDPLVNVSNNPDITDTGPAIAVDQNNNVHIVWNGFYYDPNAPDSLAGDIFYTNNKGGSFSPPVQISVSTGWYSRNPTIAVASDGNVHIAFRRSEDQMNVLSEDDIYYVTNANGSFDNPVLIVDGIFGFLGPTEVSMPYDPFINCDSQDHIHLTFRAFELGDLFEVVLYMNNVAGDWSDPVLVTQGVFITEHNSCLDSQDNVHILITDSVTYYTNNMSGGFFTPTLASSPEHENTMSAKIAVDSLGYAHIVYRALFVTPNTPDLFYVNNVLGSFSSWIPLCPGSTYYQPSIAIDDSDFVHIAYKRFPAYGGALYYGNNINGDFNFTTNYEMSAWWYPGSCYFVIGESSTLHFAFYDWMGAVYYSDTEIFYLRGNYAIPGTPTNPSPTDGAKDIPLTTTLSWSSSNATSYDVYFGTTSPPPKVGTITSSYYDPGTLNSDSTYYWKIVAKNEQGETPGPEWNFKTQVQLILSTTSGGTTNPAPGTYTYDAGTEVTLTAKPDTNYKFTYWSGDVLFDQENDREAFIFLL
ncbi:MAG: hypothetical protein WBC20_11980 [Candidatus Aminicenantaceae bacterium]